MIGAFRRASYERQVLDRLPAHQHAFLAVGLIMVPGILFAWRIRDQDVAETRGLVPASEVPAQELDGTLKRQA